MDEEETPGWLYPALGCGCLLFAALATTPPVVVALASLATPEEAIAPSVDPSLEPAPPVPTPTPPPVPTPTPPPAPPPPPPALGPAPTPFPPPSSGSDLRRVRAVITEAQGRPGIEVGELCDATVRRVPRADGTFWCRARIECAGQILYGAGTAGYFYCTLYDRPERHVVGQDAQTSEEDGDPAMRLDTVGGRLSVGDRRGGRLGAFSVVARIETVR